MTSFLSFANFRRIWTLDADTVTEVKVEDYTHYEILSREDSLIHHKYSNTNASENFEIVLHRENQSRSAFSIYRSTNSEESQLYYSRLKDILPVFARNFPNLLTTSQLQGMCRHINSNPTQNLAHVCAHFGLADYFRHLLAMNLSAESLSNIINHGDVQGKTPLQVAIEKERLQVVQSILQLGPKLDLVDEEGNNVLHFAALTNRDIIAALCASISLPNVQLLPNGSRPVSPEANENQTVPLIALINTKNHNNFTPLYLACVNDKPDCVKELLKNGADVNGASICDSNNPQRDDSFDRSDNRSGLISQLNDKDMKYGGTPLHWCKSAEVVEMLVDMNVNLNARNFNGDTALHIMITKAILPCVLTLLSHGADVNAIGAEGNTPLHLAVKTNNITIVQCCIVFGANVDTLNSSGESARHLAATANSTTTTNKDTILYILNSVCAKRCTGRKQTCTEGCSPDFTHNGVPPENTSFLRNTKLFDEILIESIVKSAVEKANQPREEQHGKKKVRLLSLDGGGIRGLILIQILAFLENALNKPIAELFDWIGGTSTGGILALLLASGQSANECRQIYFRLKDKLFIGYRPYCSDTLERFLQRHLGCEKRMNEIIHPRIMVIATVADRFPPDVKFFRNYPGPNELLNFPYKHDSLPDLKTTEELVWRVARASGAAPTYFSMFENFLDGGLISNNPTLDLLSEVQNINRVNQVLQNEFDLVDIDLVVSLGTGSIPIRNLEKLNFASLATFTGISSLATNLTTLTKVLVEQASQSNGQVVERAQAWCSMINVPYFRINPPISEEIQLDESDTGKLVNMLWETMAYLHQHEDSIGDLLTLLMIR